MALPKQSLPINFVQGLDTKTDNKQVSPGKMLGLENSVFQVGGRLTKRNGFEELPTIPSNDALYLTTFNDNLTAIGDSLITFNEGSQTWADRGYIKPLTLDVLPLIRSISNNTASSAAVSSSGLVCVAYFGESPALTKYSVLDSVTGQSVVPPTTIPGTSSGGGNTAPRVYLVGDYFIIIYPTLVGGTDLTYTAIDINDPNGTPLTGTIATDHVSTTRQSFDGYVFDNVLYFGYNSSGTTLTVLTIDSTLSIRGSPTVVAGNDARNLSITVDTNNPNGLSQQDFYATYISTDGSVRVTRFTIPNAGPFTPNTQATTLIVNAGATLTNVASAAYNAQCTTFVEYDNDYSFASIRTDYIECSIVSSTGGILENFITSRNVGIASDGFTINGITYLLTVQDSTYQPTYFIMDLDGNIINKLAYSNASGYLDFFGVPDPTVIGTKVYIPYLIKTLVQPVNKAQDAPTQNGLYSEAGINLVAYEFNSSYTSTEISKDLFLSGGILWSYDGLLPTEQGFHIWPENITITTSGTGGLITAQDYYYQVIYQWTDSQGNIINSSPSIPVKITTTGSTSSNTINIPTQRLSYKDDIKIVIYRWSTAQQSYYQVTSVTTPTVNDPTVDQIAYVDTLADSSIIGNSLIYTTGGVVENIGAPATSVMTLFRNRLFAVSAEDKNLVWYSKTVFEGAPVEMSDLFTLFVAPTISNRNTGPVTAISAMDDKLILYKRGAIFYITGTGPDITGANNDFADPVFVTSTVGCTNQNSIVFMPQGLMFQSEKGIWLLGRDLSTNYIGAPVEAYNNFTVLSAINDPLTNQVRFSLSNGTVLIYDYFYGQWGTFTGLANISSTIYSNQHTFINSDGEVFRELPGTYMDGTTPINLSFTTSWINLAGMQGFERAYFFYLLGDYLSPHTLTLDIYYDYSDTPEQTVTIVPDGSPIEQWRVFLKRQKCEAFKVKFTEVNSDGGQGLNLSGLNLIYTAKKTYYPVKAAISTS